MNKIDSFTYNTVQLSCLKTTGKTSAGTGFFVEFTPTTDESSTPIKLLLTNKHVLKDASSLSLKLCERNDDGSPNNQRHITITVSNPEKLIIAHPSEDVDLCAIPHSVLKKATDDANLKAYATGFRIRDFIPMEDMNLSAIEDVVSMGYPIARIDHHNNKPIARKGITATHPALKYEGKDEFLIDIACYKGCSGSPVFLYSPFIKHNLSPDGNQSISIDYQIKLLGIIYAAGVTDLEGEITGMPDDKAQDKDKVPIATIQTTVHLGYAINMNQVYVLLSEAAKIIQSNT